MFCSLKIAFLGPKGSGPLLTTTVDSQVNLRDNVEGEGFPKERVVDIRPNIETASFGSCSFIDASEVHVAL